MDGTVSRHQDAFPNTDNPAYGQKQSRFIGGADW